MRKTTSKKGRRKLNRPTRSQSNQLQNRSQNPSTRRKVVKVLNSLLIGSLTIKKKEIKTRKEEKSKTAPKKYSRRRSI